MFNLKISTFIFQYIKHIMKDDNNFKHKRLKAFARKKHFSEFHAKTLSRQGNAVCGILSHFLLNGDSLSDFFRKE